MLSQIPRLHSFHGWVIFHFGASLRVLVVKNPATMQELQEMCVWSLGWEHPLEKGMANHSSILDWRIPWTEETGGLQAIASQRVGHDWSYLACSIPYTYIYTPYIYIYIYIYIFIYHIFNHSFINGALRCFHILAILNISAINLGMCISFQINVFIF